MAVSPGFRETARFQLRDLPLSPLRSRAVDGCKRGRSAQRYLVEPGREVAGAGMAIVGFGSRGDGDGDGGSKCPAARCGPAPTPQLT